MISEGHPPPKLAPPGPRAEGHPLPKLAAFEPQGRLDSPREVAPSTLSESKLALSGLAADPHPLPKLAARERPRKVADNLGHLLIMVDAHRVLQL